MSSYQNSEPKVLAVTGTPGTGKTTLCDELEKQGVNVLRTGKLLTDAMARRAIRVKPPLSGTSLLTKTVTEFPSSPGNGSEIEVEPERLDEILSNVLQDIDRTGWIVVEGHLSHLLSVTGIVLLRSDPRELKIRLSTRNYSADKVAENCESELIDIIAVEVRERGVPAIELDTTALKLDACASEVRRFMDAFPDTSDFRAPGTVNWIRTVYEDGGI